MPDNLFQFFTIHLTIPSHNLVGQALFFDPEIGHCKAMVFKEPAALNTLSVIFGAGTEIFYGHAKPFLRVGRF